MLLAITLLIRYFTKAFSGVNYRTIYRPLETVSIGGLTLNHVVQSNFEQSRNNYPQRKQMLKA